MVLADVAHADDAHTDFVHAGCPICLHASRASLFNNIKSIRNKGQKLGLKICLPGEAADISRSLESTLQNQSQADWDCFPPVDDAARRTGRRRPDLKSDHKRTGILRRVSHNDCMAIRDHSVLSILLVDDEPLVCDSVKMMLAFDGHKVETASSGKQALSLLEKSKFDLVITDYDMAAMKGDKLAAIIKARVPNQPVLMITAYSEGLPSTGSSLAGVDCVVSKPFMLEDLREAIIKVLPKSLRAALGACQKHEETLRRQVTNQDRGTARQAQTVPQWTLKSRRDS